MRATPDVQDSPDYGCIVTPRVSNTSVSGTHVRLSLCAAHALYLVEAKTFPCREMWWVVFFIYGVLCTLSELKCRDFTPHHTWLWSLSWAGLTASYALPMVTSPVLLPNHHYLLAYTALAAFVSFGWRSDDDHIWGTNCRLLLASSMGFAALQKLCSVNFVTGSYFGLMLAKGEFLPLFGSLSQLAAANERTFQAFLENDPGSSSAASLRLWPWLGVVAVALSWATIGVEFVMAVTMWRRPAHPLTAKTWRWFLVLLAPFRQELVFLCVLATLGYGVYATFDAKEAHKWKWLLLVMAPLTAWRLPV